MHNYITTANLCTFFEWLCIIGAEILLEKILTIDCILVFSVQLIIQHLTIVWSVLKRTETLSGILG